MYDICENYIKVEGDILENPSISDEDGCLYFITKNAELFKLDIDTVTGICKDVAERCLKG